MSFTDTTKLGSAYWAHEDFPEDLARELGPISRHGRLFLSDSPAIESVWAQNVWLEPKVIKIVSIGDAVKKLRALGPRWNLAPLESIRRSRLIEEQLRPPRIEPRAFLDSKSPKSGCFSLLDGETMIASRLVSHPLPNGEVPFIESSEPPSRAYLKLWEFFTVYGDLPKAGDRCIDLGSCPGGWTWVLNELGCDVTSVDKAPLDESLSKRKGIRWLKHDAFTLKPEEIGPVDWLFSDVICEPRRLLELVERWRYAGLAKRFVCTIKFRGPTDHGIVSEFLAIKGSHARHLFNNKHEITWWL